jgi:hypothetical protein
MTGMPCDGAPTAFCPGRSRWAAARRWLRRTKRCLQWQRQRTDRWHQRHQHDLRLRSEPRARAGNAWRCSEPVCFDLPRRGVGAAANNRRPRAVFGEIPPLPFITRGSRRRVMHRMGNGRAVTSRGSERQAGSSASRATTAPVESGRRPGGIAVRPLRRAGSFRNVVTPHA